MKLHSFKLTSLFGKTVLATAALGFFLAAGAPAAKANDWDDCNRRVSYTEWRYREAVERFGPYSRDARHWAHERREAYERREHLRRDYRERHRHRYDRY
ncbi:MAG TPA: hypothetical protein VFI38_09550 [Candidatus Acidoferrum sp.]|nr:hypothetical protein [Candidatus Acidoferrum sp.]